MSTLLLKNGRLIDPVNGIDQVKSDVLVHDGVVVPTQKKLPEKLDIYELDGKWIVPGLIDMHVHLREPGEEYKETIETGTKTAAAAGFTAVACMPNTTPVNDCASVTRFICERAVGCDARVYPVGSISTKSEGQSLAEIGEMKAAGAVAISDDGLPVMNSQLMRRALEYSSSHNMPVISHAEESFLSSNGVMNESPVSTRLGLRGIPNAAESIMVFREIALAELTGIPVHIAHVSTAESIALIHQAKQRGTLITAETAPHYFTLTDEAVNGYDTNTKMNPPLRSEIDRNAVKIALTDGTLDAIATDHAPHSILEKEVEFAIAANGIIGLETAVPLTLALVREGLLSATSMIELLSVNPATILGVRGGSLSHGEPADITIIDPDKAFKYTKESIVSKSTNSPFLDWDFTGKAVMTIVGGRITHNELI